MGTRLTDKVAFLTGAGSGIARASAHLFAREGAKIVVADIDEPRGRQVQRHGFISRSGTWPGPSDLVGLSGGEGAVAAALRAAQEHVRSRKGWEHPFYWAAWVLWGLPD